MEDKNFFIALAYTTKHSDGMSLEDFMKELDKNEKICKNLSEKPLSKAQIYKSPL